MTSAVRTAVESALRDLTPIWQDDGRIMLSVPVRYPSGALAAIEVAGGQGIAWISDRGFGRIEAEMCGADSSYEAAGRAAAAGHGVEFDGHHVFAAKLPLSQIGAGIVAVANASVIAAGEAIRAEAEKRLNAQNEVIQRKLREAFPDAKVTPKLKIPGERAEWEAHNVVHLGDRLAVFESVSPSPQSISSKFLMFSDLAQRPNTSLNAVVDDVSKLGGKGMMLMDVAHLIEAGAPAESYRRAG